MALQPEMWQKLIIGNLYKGNEFLTRATNADQYVVGGRAVHIPNAGNPSGVVRNRTTLPATVNRRNDTDVVYLLDEFTSNPVLIPNIDKIQLSYDKMASVISEDMSIIKQVQADWLLYNWSSTGGKQIRTTGAASATTLAGATGNRKKPAKAELLQAKLIMDRDNVPADGRVALVTPDFLAELLQDKDLAVNFAQYADLANGVVGRLYGFDIMMRSDVGRFDGAGTPVAKMPDAVSATDDNACAALCWHPFAVERALGACKMFERLNDPTFYGDIYSMLVMLGGRVRRADNKGIVAIVEAPSA